MAEKPLSCINCKKKPEVTFKCFTGDTLEEVSVCKQCPWLAEKVPHFDSSLNIDKEALTRKCPSCSMTLKDLMMGEPLGCGACYTTFSTEIAEQLIECEQAYVPKGEKLTPSNLSHPISSKVLECIKKNEQLKKHRDNLDEALRLEDYERAATIRDEIKEHYESSHE